MKVDQSAFIYNLLEEENLNDYNSMSTPMKASKFIKIQGENNYKKAEIKEYQRPVGKLMYLLCGIKSNIAFVVSQLNKQNVDPYVKHLKVAKRVL